MNRKTIDHKEKHEFALFIESLSTLVGDILLGQLFTIADEKIVHRIATILRLRIGEQSIFFDSHIYVSGTIVDFIGKKKIQIKLESIESIKPLQPEITFLLPLLKREDYEQALYALAELGVNTIQLISTKKTSVSVLDQRDIDRAKRILVSAAEQSKNYAYPELKKPIPLQLALDSFDSQTSIKIFFDPMGKNFFTIMHELYDKNPRHVMVLIGPEGDLTAEEKNMVQEKGFIFCALTPTILRAVQAVALGAGFVRSILASIPKSNVFK